MGCLQAVKLGEQLLVLPLEECWTHEAACACPELQSAIKKLPERLRESCGCLISLHLLVERSKGEHATPHRRAHIELLPKEVDMLLMWGESELEELAGSKWQMIAKVCKQDILDEFGELTEALGAEELAQLGVNEESYLWAHSVQLSRSHKFYRSDDEEPLEILAPLGDMFNHHIEARQDDARLERLAQHDGKMCLCYYATRDYAIGEQAFISYGNASNGRLLFGFGFVLEDNPLDSVELALTLPAPKGALPIYEQLIAATALPELKPGQAISDDVLQAFEFVEMPSEEDASPQVVVHFRLTKTQPLGEAHLLSFLRLGACGSTRLDSEAVERLVKGDILSVAHEQQALGILRGAMESMLKGYPRSVSEDEEALQELPNGGAKFSSRRARALHVVLAEKKIFLTGIAALDERLATLA